VTGIEAEGEAGEVVVRVRARRAAAEEASLVLLAEGLSPRLGRSLRGWVLSVPAAEAERAGRVLDEYAAERRAVEAARPPEAQAEFAFAGAVFVFLVTFFVVCVATGGAVPWVERGGADAERILAGELWRTATALTLHADAPHALGNALAGTVFLGAVCGALGRGVGFALVLLAGATGNLANAWVHGASHVSVGASTAVFAAVGVLGGLGVVRRRRLGLGARRAWAPFAAAFALLALLGMSPETDLLAHALGFVAGLVAGLGAGAAGGRPPGPVAQTLSGVGALAAVVAAWLRALA